MFPNLTGTSSRYLSHFVDVPVNLCTFLFVSLGLRLSRSVRENNKNGIIFGTTPESISVNTLSEYIP